MIKNRDIKVRAWDGKRMMYRGLHDRNWYTEHKRGKLISGVHPRDEKTLYIMEDTGLKDKNGVAIYEGDIYKVNDFFIHGPITFVHPSQDGCVLDGTDRLRCNAHPTKNSTEFTSSNAWNCEVIGNIYENPELLTEGK